MAAARQAKTTIRLRIENGRPVFQQGIVAVDRKNFEKYLPEAAQIRQEKMDWGGRAPTYEECEKVLKERFERQNFHTPALARVKDDGTLQAIIFPLTWQCPTIREQLRTVQERSRVSRIRIRLYFRKEMRAVREQNANSEGKLTQRARMLLLQAREQLCLFREEIRAPLHRIATIAREGALTIWYGLPSTWKMGHDNPWEADSPRGTHIFCPEVIAIEGGPRDVVHLGVLVVLLNKMIDESRKNFWKSKLIYGIAFSRFSDFYEYIKNQGSAKLKAAKQYIEEIATGRFLDRIIRMHLNYGAVPLKLLRRGCKDSKSLDYSVLMDYTPLAVFVAASLGGDAIRGAIVDIYGRKFPRAVALARRLNGSHVTAEVDASGTTYTIDYSPFLELVKKYACLNHNAAPKESGQA